MRSSPDTTHAHRGDLPGTRNSLSLSIPLCTRNDAGRGAAGGIFWKKTPGIRSNLKRPLLFARDSTEVSARGPPAGFSPNGTAQGSRLGSCPLPVGLANQQVRVDGHHRWSDHDLTEPLN